VTLNIILAGIAGAAITALAAVLLFRRKPKKKKKPERNPLEFSKKIFLGLSVLVGVVAAFVCVMAWRTEDVSITQGLVENAFALLKVGVVSYFGKAALENKIKLASIYPKLKKQIFDDRSDAQ
jgi:multisubunit Na+/H+ antiporter MnhB subunit